MNRTERIFRRWKFSPFPRFFKDLFDFVYPPICLLCDDRYEGSGPVCPACRRRLRDSIRIQVQSGRNDFHQLSGSLFFDRALTCWDFTPELENLIHQVKYQGRKKLGLFLGKIAGSAFRDSVEAIPMNGILVPVPLHRVRLREREFNQSEWIAKGMAESVRGSIRADILQRKRNTRTQTALSAAAREKNVAEAFLIRHPESVCGCSVVLVDDVITTGATLNACARVLKESGAESVVGLALARPRMNVDRL